MWTELFQMVTEELVSSFQKQSYFYCFSATVEGESKYLFDSITLPSWLSSYLHLSSHLHDARRVSNSQLLLKRIVQDYEHPPQALQDILLSQKAASSQVEKSKSEILWRKSKAASAKKYWQLGKVYKFLFNTQIHIRRQDLSSAASHFMLTF